MAVAVPVMVLAAAFAVAAPAARPCNAPCLQTARAELRACTTQANTSFQDALDGCLARDHTCVDACRSQRQECREDTGVGAELLACDSQTEAAREQCRSNFPAGSKRRERCIDHAQLAGFHCQKAVRRSFRRALRECRRAFDPCVSACGPGLPPLGSRVCKVEERRTLRSGLADCKLTFQATSRACANRDGACIQDCAGARQTCGAPTQAALDTALAACRAAEAAAVAACQETIPGGGTALEQCITTAQAAAFTCRDTAVEASKPGFAACGEQYIGCIAACPPA